MKSDLERWGYERDPDTGVWCRMSEFVPLEYSDGDEVERRLVAAITRARDLSVLSPELRRDAVDWPSLYHLAASRANLLRPLDSLLRGRVLEVGAGCGAVTRFIGECGGSVLALEGSVQRARIARARTRDLDNVQVVAERFDQFTPDNHFDTVTLIGVLEYAGVYDQEGDAFARMLERARSLLAPGGCLILAIENQLGLKYLAGAPEDHIGLPMYGVEGRYRPGDPRTFGRRALASMLTDAGFRSMSWLVPFPDYKLPCSIMTEHGLSFPRFNADAFAWQTATRDPQLPLNTNFSLEFVWRQVFANHLALDLANSFLVVAAPEPDAVLIDSNALAYHYSAERLPEYCKATEFRSKSDGAIEVSARMLREGAVPSDTAAYRYSSIENFGNECSEYVDGEPLAWEFIALVIKDGWSIEDVSAFVVRYCDILARLTGLDSSAPLHAQQMSGAYYDSTPNNIIVRPDGSATLIDREWRVTHDIDVAFVVFRALFWLVRNVPGIGESSRGCNFTLEAFVRCVFDAVGMSIPTSRLAQYLALEAGIQSEITGTPVHHVLAAWWGEPISRARAAPRSKLEALTAEIHAKSVHIENLERGLEQVNALRINLEQELENRASTITAMQEALSATDAALEFEREESARLRNAGEELGHRIDEQAMALAAVRGHAASLARELDEVRGSTSWRITWPLRALKVSWLYTRARVSLLREVMPLAVRHFGGIGSAVTELARLAWNEGPAATKQQLLDLRLAAQPPVGTLADDHYADWVHRFDTLTEQDRTALHRRCAELSVQPLISIIMPVYNPDFAWLNQAVQSLRAQVYQNWELCIADDASTKAGVKGLLRRLSRADDRIKVTYRRHNGHIAEASNSALAIASGTWFVLMDQDDLLAEHALLYVAIAINDDPRLGLIYSDEDKIHTDGTRFEPYFKCEWNPDLFYSQNMISHLGAYRAELVREVGGFRAGFEGSQDYDLALRVIDKLDAEQIHHIPRVLYHWRVHDDSTAHSADAKPYALQAARRALEEHLEKRGVAACVEALDFGMCRIRYRLPDAPPLVSLIVPTRNQVHLLRQCIDSVVAKTAYPCYEVIIVDNGSDCEETLAYLDSLAAAENIRVLRDERPFNFSALNNAAVNVARGEVVGLINNDIEVIHPDWLNEMVSHACRSEIGAVGARLWYPNDTLQHGGVVLGLGGVAGHAHKHLPRGHHGYFGRASVVQTMSAVTAACLVVRKQLYQDVGGLNEEDLPVAFNDVDFCLRLREAGYRNLWTPFAELYHHESASRGSDVTPDKSARFAREVDYMMARWGELLRNDPAYSPNLTLDHDDFSLAWPPRVARLVPPCVLQDVREC